MARHDRVVRAARHEFQAALNQGEPALRASTALILLSGAILQVCMLRLPGGMSPWRAIHDVFPGMSGIRGVVRLQLLVMLPMALGIASATDWAWRAGRRARGARPFVIVLLTLATLEQVGGTYLYSGRDAEALSRQVAAAVPTECKAFYVVAPAELLPSVSQVSAQAFDADAYLRANPDVARDWPGTAWAHYDHFGRAEHRFLGVAAAERRRRVITFYAYTVPLAAELAGKPTVNGLSGWSPQGYDLDDIVSADPAARLRRWLASRDAPADGACLLRLKLDPVSLKQVSKTF